jgi:CheY-like chemotaxis protein
VSARELEVLVVEREALVAAAVAAKLRRRGHVVTTVATAEAALRSSPPDVIVAAVELDGMDGLQLLETLRLAGEDVRVVLMASLPELDDCRQALRLGAAEFLIKPLDVGELVSAVEGDPPPGARKRPAADPLRFQQSLPARVEQAEMTVRDLTAQLLRWGLGPTARVRIATAAVEVLDNAIRHAYVQPDVPGRVQVEAECDGREVRLCIRDEGLGFDAAALAPGDPTGPLRDPIHSGLTRAAALAERLRVHSTVGRGTRVELCFSACRSGFDDRGAIDLTELDWLTPGMSRRVLEILRREPGGDAFNLSPAVAVTVGRLLSGPGAPSCTPATLWS